MFFSLSSVVLLDIFKVNTSIFFACFKLLITTYVRHANSSPLGEIRHFEFKVTKREDERIVERSDPIILLCLTCWFNLWLNKSFNFLFREGQIDAFNS